MPTDLLLPAFALTLLANAVLITLAIRDLRRGRTDARPTRDWFTPAPAARPTGRTTEPPEQRAELGAPTPPFAPARTPDTTPEGLAPGAIPVTVQPVVQTPADPAVATPAGARTSRPRRTPRTTAPASAPSPAAAPATRRSRRKFSLPPLDDDHEKVNRSIKTFLAGADGATEPPEEPGPVSSAAARVPASSGTQQRAGSSATSTVVPTTVAIMTIFGIHAVSAVSDEDGDETASDTVAMFERAPRHGNATDALAVIGHAVVDRVATEALDMLERALHGAARGGDEVHGPEDGRFRIVLPATGELAARAYVRRIRALIEPQLDGAERPMRLVVATATALNVPVETATATAMRRLDAALAGHAEGATAAMPSDAAGGGGDADPDVVFAPRTAGD